MRRSVYLIVHEAILVALCAMIGVLLRILCREAYISTLVGPFITKYSFTNNTHVTMMQSGMLKYGMVNLTPDAIFLDFYSNMLGCLGLGALVYFKTKSSLFELNPRYLIGLTSGMMGSLTSFSSWQVEVATKMWLFNPWTGIVGILLGWTCAYCSFLAGNQLSEALHGIYLKRKAKSASGINGSVETNGSHGEDAPSPSYLVRFIDVTTWILCVAMFITVLLFVLLWRGKEREILISCLGAIPGALLRWYLAKFNVKVPTFPLFTLVANLCGTVIFMIVHTCVLVTDNPNHDTQDTISALLLTGFTGALTTVSTLVSEVHNVLLKSKRMGWFYAFVTIATTQLLLLCFNIGFEVKINHQK